MTDKQIIFKCDVDCIRKNTEECFELDCIKGQESILKQLKAKEQECEELNKWLPIVTRLEVAFGSIETEKTKSIDYNTYARKIFRQLDQLEEENKELRQLLSKEPLALQALQRAYSSYKKSTDVFYKMAKDYKQVLTEIKEIINICRVNNCNSECEFYKMDDCQDERLHRIRQILQKCEVLDE